METILRDAITAALYELGIADIDFTIEHPSDFAHGDYATNAALIAIRKMESPPEGGPLALAKQLVSKLKDKIAEVDSIEVAGPGFINFYLSREFFTKSLTEIDGKAWGTNDTWKGKTVLVEYTDPNPFKEFHIGHLFTNSVGESIARLFEAAGANVKRVNYQGDVGMHVAHAVWGMRKMGITADTEFSARDLGRAYALGATAYKEDETSAREMKEINKLIYERSDEEVNALYDKGRAVSLEYFESIYNQIGTTFDYYFFESEAAPKGKELVLAHRDVFTESNGAQVFNGEQYGLHTRVFLNSEGLPTYEAKELALAYMKNEVCPYDYSVVATSNEINEYFKVLKKVMSLIYPDLEKKTEHIGHGTVRLATGKMSSRTGNVIAAVDFIEEIAAVAARRITEIRGEVADGALPRDIAIAAIKYATLRSSIFQDSVFDKDQALSFEGDSGPYLQYTHARIESVLRKAKEVGIKPSVENAPETPYEIERILYRFPEIVLEALHARSAHHVVLFLTELAGEFNTFYGSEKIVDSEDIYAPYKLALAEAVQITLKNGLQLLGIKAPEKM